MISYAYPAVREYLQNIMREWFEWGADGACILFNRGCVQMLYDDPVVSDFHGTYGIHPGSIPEDDPRWIRHLTKWVTSHLAELRAFVDDQAAICGKPLQLGAYMLGSREYSEFFGFDVPNLARSIFDFICVRGDYFLPGIDIQQWHDKWGIDRGFFRKGVEGADCMLYYDLMPRQMTPDEYVAMAKEHYEAGADGLSMWDSCDRHPWIDMWQTVQRLGHRDDLRFVSHIRILQQENRC